MAHAEGRPRAGWVWVVYLSHGRVHDVSFVCPSWCDKPAEKARRALQEAAFFLHPLLPETDASMLQSFEALLKTERPDWLEKGRDVSKRYGPCDKLKLACPITFTSTTSSPTTATMETRSCARLPVPYEANYQAKQVMGAGHRPRLCVRGRARSRACGPWSRQPGRRSSHVSERLSERANPRLREQQRVPSTRTDKMHGDLQKSAKDTTLEHSLFAAFNTD